PKLGGPAKTSWGPYAITFAGKSLGEFKATQTIGFKAFDPAGRKFEGYRWLTLCAPAIGCFDAVAQNLRATLRSYPVNPPIAGGVQGGAAAGYGQFYVLDIESETAQRNLELKPPAIAVPTPVGPVQAQLVFTYDARVDVVQAPLNMGSLDTRRDSLDEPGWKRQTGQHDIF